MLKELRIRNFALIRELTFVPGKGLNIITGETGAGKSILLDALSLILGERGGIRTQSEFGEKCIVEGLFDVAGYDLEKAFAELDIDYSDEVIIRREINPAGKSRTFINDSPVQLAVLRSLSGRLVNIHSQHENTALNTSEFQTGLVDAFAGITEQSNKFGQLYRQHLKKLHALDALKQSQSRLIKEKDYLEFLSNELDVAGFKSGEEEEMEKQLAVLSNADEIDTQAAYVAEKLYGEEQSISDQVTELKNRIKPISNLSAALETAYNRLSQLAIEAKDLSREMEALRSASNADPAKLNHLNERLQLLQTLKRKHGANDLDELEKIFGDISSQLLEIGNIDEELERTELDVVKSAAGLASEASKISKARKKVIPLIEKKISGMLEDLELKQAEFTISAEQMPEGHYNEAGSDTIRFYFTANAGMPPQPLNKVASGGELSRLALCFKSVIAENSSLPTLIFDEIDTGVSGEVAHKIGLMMHQLGKGHQVIAVTHLPQVASKGDQHFFIYKSDIEGKVSTSIKKLTPEERIIEVAKILSGNNPGDNALANAKELLMG
ncbi:MAG: DNA repair protein RecN [Bacteroidia bacterium]|nr:DNA repair protein RecN [Bacteroidia bacterium]